MSNDAIAGAADDNAADDDDSPDIHSTASGTRIDNRGSSSFPISKVILSLIAVSNGGLYWRSGNLKRKRLGLG